MFGSFDSNEASVKRTAERIYPVCTEAVSITLCSSKVWQWGSACRAPPRGRRVQ